MYQELQNQYPLTSGAYKSINNVLLSSTAKHVLLTISTSLQQF